MAEVELPQLGESVTEGIITAWLVAVGDTVEVDQPIVEISTDKVDTEIPSPVAGTVSELKADVDDTIEVGQVIAVIDDADDKTDDADEGEKSDDGDSREDDGDQDDGDQDDGDQDDGDEDGDEGEKSDDGDSSEDDGDEGDDGDRPAASGGTGSPSPSGSGGAAEAAGRGVLASPLVRRLLREAALDPSQVTGSGPGGRITREDAEQAIEHQQRQPADGQPASAARVTPPPAVVEAPATRSRPPASPTQVDFDGRREVTEDLSRVRRAIARSMMDSLQTTAQLTAVVEVDLTAIMNLRAAHKGTFRAREGVGLSPLSIVSRAVCLVLPRHPVLNSSMDGEAGTVTYHGYVNLGMAVDTERGLLVPNVKDAQDLTVGGLARRIADLAERARSKRLQPDEIAGGTFTITNTGSVGTLLDTPVLNPPEVAILATAAIEKRPVVVSDAYGDSIAIRWMSYLCLSYDHRMVDGADAARFLQDLKFILETHDFGPELGA